MSIIVYVVGAAAAFIGGGYVEHKFSSAVSADVAALKARVAALEAKAKADVAAIVADVKKV